MEVWYQVVKNLQSQLSVEALKEKKYLLQSKFETKNKFKGGMQSSFSL